MKVAELIEQLEKFDPEAEVHLWDYPAYEPYPVSGACRYDDGSVVME